MIGKLIKNLDKEIELYENFSFWRKKHNVSVVEVKDYIISYSPTPRIYKHYVNNVLRKMNVLSLVAPEDITFYQFCVLITNCYTLDCLGSLCQRVFNFTFYSRDYKLWKYVNVAELAKIHLPGKIITDELGNSIDHPEKFVGRLYVF